MKPFASLLESPTEGAPRKLSVPHARRAQVGGFAEGYREGLQTARREAEELLLTAQANLDKQREAQEAAVADRLRRLESLITALETNRAHPAATQEHAVVSLAYEALLRILHDADQARPILHRIVAQALDQHIAGPVSIRVCPADLSRIEADQALGAMIASQAGVRLVADETLPPNACVIDSPQGSEDRSLAAQLNNLTQAWLAALGEGGRT